MKNGKTIIHKPHIGTQPGQTREVGKTTIIFHPTPANAGHDWEAHAAPEWETQPQVGKDVGLWSLQWHIEIYKLANDE